MSSTTRVVYVTSSKFKVEENRVLVDKGLLSDGTPVKDLFVFEIRPLPIKETLEVDLRAMVTGEVTEAYSQVKVPCIVEHAGLIFESYEKHSYPGGLTKPMWNTLGESFLEETRSAGRRALARAVIAYCDGMTVSTFVGETRGTLAPAPRGNRSFYWDTVFIPDDPDRPHEDLTYAEVVERADLGLEYKVLRLSQSTKAMLLFLDHLRAEGPGALWSR